MKKKDLSELGSLFYSTNPDINPGSFTPHASEQLLYVLLDKKHRSGKVVTIVTGYEGKEEDLNVLAKKLKVKCGTGGSVKDGEIIIQGDFRDRIIKLLKDDGYQVKKAGG